MSILTFVLLIVGFVLLIKGADFFVDGASAIAKIFNVPTLIIGMTIVAIGTSLPETAVSITASILGSNEMAISNAIGSNTFNLLVVIGVSALITTVKVQHQTTKYDIPISIGCALFLAAAAMVYYFLTDDLQLGRVAGAILILLFIGYIIYMIYMAKHPLEGDDPVEEEEEIKSLPVGLAIFFIIAGAAAIAIGGDLVVDEAEIIAKFFGMSDTLIGLTIVALGTSLPELATSIASARKGMVDMALGNAVGSNICNILMVVGIAAVASPIDLTFSNACDILILVGMSTLVLVFGLTKKKISRTEGLIMVLVYAFYLAYVIMREMHLWVYA